jgi:hypothetical protein
MGFNVSWLAVRGFERRSLLSTLGLVPTGETAAFPGSMECGCELPGGFYLLFLNHPWHRFTEPEALESLSRGCEVIGCRIEEHNMSSAAFLWKNGICAWSVVHTADRDVRNLRVAGTPPSELDPIKSEAAQRQDAEKKPFFIGLLSAEIDHFFRVPIDLAAKLVGYEHDRVTQPWGKAKYELLAVGALH